MKKSILTPILAVIDIALLVLIVVSARSVGNGPTDTPAAIAEVSIAEVTSPAETETVISPAETSVRQTQEETTESIPEVTTESIPYDEARGIASIHATHLSTYCGFPIQNENTKNAMIAYISNEIIIICL